MAPSGPSAPMTAASAAGAASAPRAMAPARSAAGVAMAASAAAAPASGASAPARPDPAAPRPFADVIKDATQQAGFVPLWRKDERLWLEIPTDLLDKPFLFSANIASSVGERGLYAQPDGPVVAGGVPQGAQPGAADRPEHQLRGHRRADEGHGRAELLEQPAGLVGGRQRPASRAQVGAHRRQLPAVGHSGLLHAARAGVSGSLRFGPRQLVVREDPRHRRPEHASTLASTSPRRASRHRRWRHRPSPCHHRRPPRRIRAASSWATSTASPSCRISRCRCAAPIRAWVTSPTWSPT